MPVVIPGQESLNTASGMLGQNPGAMNALALAREAQRQGALGNWYGASQLLLLAYTQQQTEIGNPPPPTQGAAGVALLNQMGQTGAFGLPPQFFQQASAAYGTGPAPAAAPVPSDAQSVDNAGVEPATTPPNPAIDPSTGQWWPAGTPAYGGGYWDGNGNITPGESPITGNPPPLPETPIETPTPPAGNTVTNTMAPGAWNYGGGLMVRRPTSVQQQIGPIDPNTGYPRVQRGGPYQRRPRGPTYQPVSRAGPSASELRSQRRRAAGAPRAGEAISRFAKGGQLTGLGLVGEEGPELVYAPRGAEVVPLKGGRLPNINNMVEFARTPAGRAQIADIRRKVRGG